MEEAAAAFVYVESQCNLQDLLLQVFSSVFFFFFLNNLAWFSLRNL